MRNNRFIFRNSALIILIIFAATAPSWSASHFSLRPISAVERSKPDNRAGYTEVPIRRLGYVFSDEDALFTAGGGISLISNPEIFARQLEAARRRAGGDDSNVIVSGSLIAGKGTRFERDQMIVLIARYGLEARLSGALMRIVRDAARVNDIMKDRVSMLNSAEFEAAAREVLGSHTDEILPKVIYPMDGVKPVALQGKTAAEEVGMPVLMLVGHESSRVISVLGEKDITYVFQPGFEHTARVIKPGRWVLGTGYALAELLRGIPENFRGAVFVAMGDMPFIDAQMLKEVRDKYFEAIHTDPRVKAISILGTITGDPRQSSYGRMVLRNVTQQGGESYMVLDRIVEPKDILAMINASGGKPKAESLRNASQDSQVQGLCGRLNAVINVPALTIEIPAEGTFSQEQIGLRRQLDDVLRTKYGLLRLRYSGEVRDGQDLIGERHYNPAVYIFDYQALRNVIFNLVNDNASREYYATDISTLLEELFGFLTVCVKITNQQTLAGVNLLSELPGPQPIQGIGGFLNAAEVIAGAI